MLLENRYQIIETEIGPLISDSRVSVYDVMVYLDEDKDKYEISIILNLTPLQVQTAIEYIKQNQPGLESELAVIQAKEKERRAYHRAIAEEVQEKIKQLPMTDVGLKQDADDEIVWRLCQDRGYILVTGNRSTNDGKKSLELTVRHLTTPNNLPILTIGNLERILHGRDYCEKCAERLAEIVFELPIYRRVMRLYLLR